jgi:hypothetical protein
VSEKEELAKLIASHTVSWDQACLIADSILDTGWASAEELQFARSHGYDEAIAYAVDRLEDSRKIQEKLRGVEPDELDLRAARYGIDSTSPISYSQFESWNSEVTLNNAIQDIKQYDSNPFRT